MPERKALTVERVLENGEKFKETYIYIPREISLFQKARDENDWLSALRFFFNRVLFQGRADTISSKVFRRVTESIEEAIRETGENVSLGDLKEVLRPKLERRIGRGKVGKGGDIELVMSTLNFLEEEVEDRNIINYSIRLIKFGQIDCLYYRLCEEIKGVGPKTASLFLRDLYFIAEEEIGDSFRRSKDFLFLLPVDVWVRRVVSCLGLFDYPPSKWSGGSSELDRELRKVMVEKFMEKAPLFDAGAWYTGFHEMKRGFYPECIPKKS